LVLHSHQIRVQRKAENSGSKAGGNNPKTHAVVPDVRDVLVGGVTARFVQGCISALFEPGLPIIEGAL